ncbi:MAG: nicotinate-nicotinamide nucleotide adenylyltransferase, partial [Lacrimispora sphenoides]
MGKIGIMGGTFDPIHNGHLMLGEQAYKEYGLKEVWYMPSGHPPHKKSRNVTEPAIRLAMTELAVKSYEGFVCS